VSRMKEILPRIITDLVWVSAAHITHALRNDPTVNGTGRVISPTTKHIIFLFPDRQNRGREFITI
jgi:hypothetical protein